MSTFAPSFSLHSIVPKESSALATGPLCYSGRDWGVPMLLPLNESLEDLQDAFPCPLLELDHF